MLKQSRVEGSFRDTSGFVFKRGDIFFRQVNQIYKTQYDTLQNSGLYNALVASQMMLAHEEIEGLVYLNDSSTLYKVLKPQQLSLITQPYNWSFSMIRDAALLTLAIQKKALTHQMTLKDANGFNIQFIGCRPVFIDTLSFDHYTEGDTWQAYGQFCRHFLAPLALMSHRDISLSELLMSNIDGIPLPLTSKLLPFKTRFNIGLALHIHLHANSVKKYDSKKINIQNRKFSRQSLISLIESLESCIKGLKWKPENTEWFDYYDKSTTASYLEKKESVVKSYLNRISPKKVLDWGANDGKFSEIAAHYAHNVISCDNDTACVELNYLRIKQEGITNITPLVIDIANPEPAIGWNNQERPRVLELIQSDTIMALALIHHIRISNNTPICMIASFFSQYCQNLIIEFVPKSDDKVKTLLQNRLDIFDDYDLESFEAIFSTYFSIIEKHELMPTNRVLYLMHKK
jgi:hypothetical protein